MATMTTGPAVSSGQTLRKHLSVTDGFVLYTSAVLGQSLIVLPSIAARHAGPWSILVWAALAAVSYPLARIMAELGARNPSRSEEHTSELQSHLNLVCPLLLENHTPSCHS